MAGMLFFFVILNIIIALSKASSVNQRFRQFDIVPQIIRNSPYTRATVRFSDGSEAELGNLLSLTTVATQPEITYMVINPIAFYTVLMIDPNVPVYPPGTDVLFHMLTTNVKGNDVTTGKTVFSYLSPTPPPLTGPDGNHRYIQLVYQQKGHFDNSVLQGLIVVDRFACFSEFLQKNNFTKPLVPIAGNFFLANGLNI